MIVERELLVFRSFAIDFTCAVGLIGPNTVQSRAHFERTRCFLLANQRIHVPLLILIKVFEFIDQVQHLDSVERCQRSRKDLRNTEYQTAWADVYRGIEPSRDCRVIDRNVKASLPTSEQR